MQARCCSSLGTCRQGRVAITRYIRRSGGRCRGVTWQRPCQRRRGCARLRSGLRRTIWMTGRWAQQCGAGRGGGVWWPHQHVGEAAALAQLDAFIDAPVQSYKQDRDFPALTGATSGLSENLAWGEIGPRTIWAAGQRAVQQGADGAEHFLKELV